MAIRNIRLSEDALLRKKSREVKEITPAILTLLDDLADTMYAREGVGLAAPQVGVLRRVAVIDMQDDKGLVELINPVIVEKRGEQEKNEACLSVPGLQGLVVRPAYVKVQSLNRQGETFFIEGKDNMAIALCHELDHLDGILYIDLARNIVDNGSGEADA